MVNLPLQLTHDLERLRDDSHPASPNSPTPDSPAETEELVAKAIHLYSRLNRQHERWAVSIREGRSPFSLQDGKLWQTTFQKWCDDARQIICQAKSFETAGQHVDQLDELRNTLTHCDYDGLNIDSLIQSAADLDQGKGIPVTELHNELQRGLGPTAKDKLLALPAGVAWRVREAIGNLCEQPTALSRPSGFPHPLHFQLFETRIQADGEEMFLRVFFHYHQDEQSLLIDDITLLQLS